MNEGFRLFDGILSLVRLILTSGFHNFGIIIINTFLSLIALEKDLSVIFHVNFFSHKLLIGIVGNPIISFQKFGVLKPQNIEDSSILQYIVLKLASFLLAYDFKYIQGIEQDLFFLISWDIDKVDKAIIILNDILIISFNIFKSDLDDLIVFPFSGKFLSDFDIFSRRDKAMNFNVTSKTIFNILSLGLRQICSSV